MSINYSIIELKNPLRPEDTPQYYARMQVQEEIPLSRLAEEVS